MKYINNLIKSAAAILFPAAILLSACSGSNVAQQITDTVEAGADYNPLHFITTNDDYSVSLKQDNIEIQKPGTYTVLYEITSPALKYIDYEIKVTVKDTTAPEFSSDSAEGVVGEKFDITKAISANDIVDGNVTKKIKITKGSVDTSKENTCKITAAVEDSHGNKAEKEITVNVVDRVKAEKASNAFNAAKTALLGKIKYPDSLSVNKVLVSEGCGGYDYLVKIDCRLKNSSGVEMENTFFIGLNGGKAADSQFTTDMQKKNGEFWNDDGAINVQP